VDATLPQTLEATIAVVFVNHLRLADEGVGSKFQDLWVEVFILCDCGLENASDLRLVFNLGEVRFFFGLDDFIDEVEFTLEYLLSVSSLDETP